MVLLLDGEDRFGQIEAHLGRIYVEGSYELDVAHVVPTERHVHQTGNSVPRVGVAVVLDPLYEGAGTVADSRDGYLDLAGRNAHGSLLSVTVSTKVGLACTAAAFTTSERVTKAWVGVRGSPRAQVGGAGTPALRR